MQLDLALDRRRHVKPQRRATGRGQFERLTTQTYRPLDELLEHPTVRILRALKWFDWVSFEDLADAMDLEADPKVRNNFSSYVCMLARQGLIESRPGSTIARISERRITTAGRAELKLILARATLSRVSHASRYR